MATTRRGSTRARLTIVAAAVLFAAAVWFVARDDAQGTPGEALRGLALDEPSASALPAAFGASSTEPQPLDVAASAAASPPDSASSDDPAPPPLVFDVRHAHGPPAAHAMLVITDGSRKTLLEDRLDAQGHWEGEGFDHAIEIYVAGASVEFLQFLLTTGRGAHELTLPEGGWVSGRVLVDGAAPGEPFPLRLDEMASLAFLPRSAAGVSEFVSRVGSGFVVATVLTPPDGRFLVSGFPAGAEVRVSGASELFSRDVTRSSPESVTAPFDDYLLALRRVPVIRGRLLHTDGTPAAGLRFQLAQQVTRGPPAEPRYQPLETREGRGAATDDDGAFEVPVADSTDGCRCMDSESGEVVDEDACGPLELVVSLTATGGAGEALDVERRVRSFDRDVDLGELWMRAAAAHTLRVLDSAGEPIHYARVALEGSDRMRAWQAGGSAWSDDEGLVSFLASDADLGAATVSAAMYEPVRVELPDPPRSAPIDVVLPPATRLALRVRWPASWREPDVRRWYVELRGVAPLLRSEVGRAATSGVPLDGSGAEPAPPSSPFAPRARAQFPSKPSQRVGLSFSGGGSAILLDDLRADTPYALRLLSRRPNARVEPGTPEPLVYWELDGVSLQRGEYRVIDVDLRASTLPSPRRHR